MSLEHYRNLDLNNPGGWPLGAKLISLVLVVAVIAAAGWYFDWRYQRDELAQVRSKEQDLRREFEKKQERAANLEAYEKQLAQMRESFGAMLSQLPSRAEVARLLVDISETGLSAGLAFELFKPQSSIKREFYAELPVNIRVRGTYHEFAQFISGVANLPRIVTLHDVSISSGDDKEKENDNRKLVMELTARTYWYLDTEGGG